MPAKQNAIVGLHEETLEKLRDLRRMTVDSAKGFEECAELVKDHGYKEAFAEFAAERREMAEALGAHIEWNEGAEPEEGSYAAALHRAWIKVRESISSDSVQPALEEAERGEDIIKNAYQEALDEVVGSPIHGDLSQQYARIKRTHDRVRELRDMRKQ